MLPAEAADHDPYRISRFCHLLPVKEAMAIYHSVLIKVLFVNHEVAGLLDYFRAGITKESFFRKTASYEDREGLKNLIDRLVELRMLVPVHEREEELLTR